MKKERDWEETGNTWARINTTGGLKILEKAGARPAYCLAKIPTGGVNFPAPSTFGARFALTGGMWRQWLCTSSRRRRSSLRGLDGLALFALLRSAVRTAGPGRRRLISLGPQREKSTDLTRPAAWSHAQLSPGPWKRNCGSSSRHQDCRLVTTAKANWQTAERSHVSRKGPGPLLSQQQEGKPRWTNRRKQICLQVEGRETEELLTWRSFPGSAQLSWGHLGRVVQNSTVAWSGEQRSRRAVAESRRGGQTGSRRGTSNVIGRSTEPRLTSTPMHQTRGWEVKGPSPDGFKNGAEGKCGRKFPKFKIRSQTVKVSFMLCQGHISESEVNVMGLLILGTTNDNEEELGHKWQLPLPPCLSLSLLLLQATWV